MLFRTVCFALLLAFFGTDLILGQHKNAIELKQCYLKDKTKFETCMLTFWKAIGQLIKTGIPELYVPVLDPMLIPFVEYKDQGALIQANIKFANSTAVGASNVVVTTVRVDPKAGLVTANATIPYLNITGNYTMKGTIMLLPVDNSGRFSINMTGMNLNIRGYPVQKGAGIRVNKIEIDFSTKNTFMKLYNLLEGDEVGKALNAIIDENGNQLFQELQPLIDNVLENRLQNLTAELFSDIPAEAFFSNKN